MDTTIKVPTQSEAQYLASHVGEELDGAKEYATKALMLKEENPGWARQFYSMSYSELDHADRVLNMLRAEVGKSSDGIPIYTDALDKYLECKSKIEQIHEMYKKK